MPNVTKIAPVGVDISIQNLQTYLFTKLCSTWNIDGSLWNSYGRAYRNQTADGYTPEVYTGGINKSTDYKEVMFSDTVALTSFFFLGEVIKRSGGAQVAPVSMIFTVNLPKLKPDITHRADEEVRVDVQKLLTTPKYGFEMTGWQLGIDNVFREFSGWKKTTGIKYRDEHPTHCFRIDMNLLYTQFNC